MSKRAFMLVVVLTTPSVLGAQQPAARMDTSAVRAFASFRQTLTGSWCATIKDWGDGSAQSPIWSDVQRRTFAVTIAREVLEERALFKSARGDDVVGGVHLFLLDRASGTVHGHGFWPPYADRMIHITGRMATTGLGFEGNMSVFDRDRGRHVDRRMAFQAVNQDSLAWQVYDRRSDGTEYAREQLFYRRSTQGECSAPRGTDGSA